jgi:hypothetical protein
MLQSVRVKNNFRPSVLSDMIQAVKAAEEYVSTFITPRKDNKQILTDKVFPLLARNPFCGLSENFLANLLFFDEESH